MARHIWLKVTNDEFELPLVTAMSSAELERKLGISKGAVASAIYHAKKRGYKCEYKSVEITEEEWNELR